LGRVEFAEIRAGVGFGGLMNADAQIGTVSVGGDWIASSIAAGTTSGPNSYFGDADDVKMSGNFIKDVPTVSSRIASLNIAGQALGYLPIAVVHFGIVAENIGAVRIGGTPLPLVPGNGNDEIVIGITNDFSVNEV